MIVYPAIDIRGGVCVRLRHGDFDQATLYNPDPVDQARQFIGAGAVWIHCVDLDAAAQGKAVNKDVIERMIKIGGKIQLGGGIRKMADIETYLEQGISRVVLGTAALKNPDLVRQAAKIFPGQIAVAADAKEGMIATEGWLEMSDVAANELVKRFEDCGVSAVIFTDIGRDGALTGVNQKATVALAEAVSIPIIASGGVASLDDLVALAKTPIEGVIIGRALYDGRIGLEDALSFMMTETH